MAGRILKGFSDILNAAGVSILGGGDTRWTLLDDTSSAGVSFTPWKTVYSDTYLLYRILLEVSNLSADSFFQLQTSWDGGTTQPTTANGTSIIELDAQAGEALDRFSGWTQIPILGHATPSTWGVDATTGLGRFVIDLMNFRSTTLRKYAIIREGHYTRASGATQAVIKHCIVHGSTDLSSVAVNATRVRCNDNTSDRTADMRVRIYGTTLPI